MERKWGVSSLAGGCGTFGLEDLSAEQDGCLWPNGMGLHSAIQSLLP